MAHRGCLCFFAVLVGTGVATEGAAQEASPTQTRPSVGELTGRPGQSGGGTTVPRGFVLLNLGLQANATDAGEGDSSRSLTSPDALLRIGVLDNLEVRGGSRLTLSGPSGDAPAALSLPGVSVGATARVLKESDWVPALALLAQLDAPTATLRLEDTTLSALLLASKSLWGPLAVVVNAGARGDSRRGATALLYTAAVSVSGASGASSFIEVFGEVPTDAVPSASVDAGVALDLTRNLRVDALVGVPLTGGTRAVFVGAGISLLFDTAS